MNEPQPIPLSYVTTEDTCSHCGVKLANAERSRLEFQGEAFELGKKLAAAEQRAKELEGKLADAINSEEFCRDWYSQRFERLSRFIREEISEPQKTRYFSIIANGAADHMEQNTYGYQMNLLRIEKDAAIERERVLREAVTRISELKDFISGGHARNIAKEALAATGKEGEKP